MEFVNLNTYRTRVQYAHDLMALHGLIQSGWRICVNRRARSFAGRCIYNEMTIALSGFLLWDKRTTAAELRETVLHEIAHALAGPGTHHGPTWKAIAQSIGCTGDRCTSRPIVTEDHYRIVTCECNRVKMLRLSVKRSLLMRRCAECMSFLHVVA